MKLKFSSLLICTWILSGFLACSDEVAGRTSETDNTITVAAGLENGRPGASMTFVKRLDDGGFANSSEVADVDQDGQFQVELDKESYYFVEYQDDRHASWLDSMYTGKKGEQVVFEMEAPTFEWKLKGQLPIQEFPEAETYEIGFKNTPFFTRVDSDGSFSLDKAVEGKDLAVRFVKNQEYQWIDIINWSSEWFGVVDLYDLKYEEGQLTVDLCAQRNPLIMLHSTENKLHYESTWSLCNDVLNSDQSIFQDRVSQSQDVVVKLDSNVLYLYDYETRSFGLQMESSSLLNVYSVDQNEFGVAAIKYLPSGSTLVSASSMDSLDRGKYSQEIALDSDSTFEIQFWDQELILWNESGTVEIRHQSDLTEVLYKIELDTLVDLARLSSDHILVLRDAQVLEAIQLSTGELIAQKTIDNLGELYDLGFLEAK